MSFLEENSGVKMDYEESKKDESGSCSEDPARSPLEPDPSQTSVGSVHSGPKVNPSGPETFILSDSDHKVLVMDSGTLRAVPKKAYILPETFSVLATHVTSASDKKGSPILLAVKNGERSLCCNKEKGKCKPSLQLMEKKLGSLNSLKEPARKPFVFHKAPSGSLYTLESAAHPGWFICTSCNSGDPVRVTNKLGKKEHTEFMFKKVCQTEPSQ